MENGLQNTASRIKRSEKNHQAARQKVTQKKSNNKTKEAIKIQDLHNF